MRKRSLIFFAAELCASIGSLVESFDFFFLATGFGELENNVIIKKVYLILTRCITYDFRGGIVVDFLCLVTGTVGVATASFGSAVVAVVAIVVVVVVEAAIGFIAFFAINSLVSDTNL